MQHPTLSLRTLVRVLQACGAAAPLVLAINSGAHAARPMVTDDARIVDPGACQIETWRRGDRGSYESWALPACNFTGNLEVTLGATDQPEASGGRAADIVLQGKTVFKTLETNGYGYGLVVGGVSHSDRIAQQESVGSIYGYVPISKSFHDDRLIVHVNLGALQNRDVDTKAFTWGVGGEFNVTSRVALIAETYGNNHSQPFVQGGLRIWIVPNRFQVDTTIGAQSGDFGPTRWWTIGMRLISPPFLR